VRSEKAGHSSLDRMGVEKEVPESRRAHRGCGFATGKRRTRSQLALPKPTGLGSASRNMPGRVNEQVLMVPDGKNAVPGSYGQLDKGSARATGFPDPASLLLYAAGGAHTYL